jgi:SOS-response transcriptional repressor LexA
MNSDAKHLAVLRQRFARDGVLPSYAGISKALGFRSKNASVKLVQRLAQRGFIRSGAGGRLAPQPKFFGIRLATDPVRAGRPQTADHPELVEMLSLDSYLIDSPTSTILVPVKGDSMVEAGILDGDLAVVDTKPSAQAGDIVVAEVDGEFTLKELRYRGDRAYLQPRHPTMAAIWPRGSLRVVGVVRGIVRRTSRRRPSRNKPQEAA